MIRILASLAIAVTAPAIAALPDTLAVEGVQRVDRVLLPPTVELTRVRVHALERFVEVDTASPAALVRALRVTPLALCPDIDEAASGVVMHCRSRRIVARVTQTRRGHALEIAETRGLPWDGRDGAPFIPFEPGDVALGGACPGSSPAGRAECLLAGGNRAAARKAFGEIAGPDADGLAALRLGDLAYAEGDVLAATAQWGRARGVPWERLAAARLCELSWVCIATSDLAEVYRRDEAAPSVARELELRRARALGFLGRAPQAAQALFDTAGAAGCSAAPALCRDIAATALVDAGPGALDALALWLSLRAEDQGAGAYQASISAAAVAEREGAQIFAANLLAAAAGQVPPRSLRDHLLRTAELFLAGGDRVRAGVVFEFARAHAGRQPLKGPRWAAVAREIAGHEGPAAGAEASRDAGATRRPGRSKRTNAAPAASSPALEGGAP